MSSTSQIFTCVAISRISWRLKHEAAWCSTFSCLETSQTRYSAEFQIHIVDLLGFLVIRNVENDGWSSKNCADKTKLQKPCRKDNVHQPADDLLGRPTVPRQSPHTHTSCSPDKHRVAGSPQ
ncbi:hypothetical protein T265_05879 [Opisthorchis viverrini]|uniref:Uncharacterized protein n=1 Tax=Opisthorchis viverrini TaxID=6198 RepID=A0A074ZJ02_OPIVI|nr:hypothetical protein T265_05879 [Opisthorchis viverrini]KER26971.1 hypothetical protein T265_05879 [Opisthorchis viverrini]